MGLKLGVEGAIATPLVQIVPLLLAGADASGAGGVVAGAALWLHLIVGKNEELTGWQGDGAALVILTRLGVVIVAHLFRIVAGSVLPATVGNPLVHAVIERGAIIIRTQHGLLREGFLNCAANVRRHAANSEGGATAKQVRS